MPRLPTLLLIAVLGMFSPVHGANDAIDSLETLRRPLSKADALNIAFARNGTVLQARKDVEAATGVSIQLRAIVYPKLLNQTQYSVIQDSLIEANQNRQSTVSEADIPGLGALRLEGSPPAKTNNQDWNSDIRVVHSVYEGGRIGAALRSSRLIRDQALLSFQATAADVLLSVSNAYDDVLSTAKQVEVREASVALLTEYLKVAKTKADAGAVTEFEVLRQEVEVANAQAALVQALGVHRVAKQVFAQQLGWNLSTDLSDDLPLRLTSPLVARPYPHPLSAALAHALVWRTEVAALKKEELLRDEGIVAAKAGTKPSLQAFAGYELASRVQTRNAGDPLSGGIIGGQLSWPLFDGFLTKGRVAEAVARRGKAGEATAETKRVVELQVRAAWSDLRAARAVLDAEAKNIEKAVQALSLVQTRYDEGAATQVEVLSAQTALTDARTLYVQGLRNYSVARSRLVRATGEDLRRSGAERKAGVMGEG